ncbi:hypothetical protein SAMN02745903_00333 [Pseudomonas sp. URMO17WK12:I5]|nr:hypothetical protein H040_00333 [Pseudomonas sp. URMO17WK12:I7]SME92486.1 hypothetical protein SAMN02745903_00333 [Pseudomonas sp. URMO17WK12:I5]
MKPTHVWVGFFIAWTKAPPPGNEEARSRLLT